MTGNRIAGLTAALTLAIAAAAHAQHTDGVSAGRIVIALPERAPGAEPCNAVRAGALAYFERVNAAGGVHGRMIVLAAPGEPGAFVLLGCAGAAPEPLAGDKHLPRHVYPMRARYADEVENLVVVAREHRAALGRSDYSFASLESFVAAKVLVEGMRRAGPRLTRAALVRAMEGLRDYDAGGYRVGFDGSSYVELTVLGLAAY